HIPGMQGDCAPRDFCLAHVRSGSIATATQCLPLPLILRKRRYSGRARTHTLCRYCCKSRKLPGDNFPAESGYVRRPPIFVASVSLPRSPVSLWSGDEVPHIFTRTSRVRLGEFLITCAKRLLQQNLR